MKFFKKSNDAENLILNFLNKENLLESNREGLINSLNKNFSSHNTVSETVYDSLIKLIDENPQLLIDKVKSFASNTEELTTIFTQGKKEYDTVKKKMDFISLIWETATILNFAIYLKTKNQAVLSSSSNANSVLSHFKDMNFTSNDIELTRKIRNTNNHKFNVIQDKIITDEEEIEIKDINAIYEKLNFITSWWLTFIMFSLYHIPKFGLMVVYSWIVEWQGDINKYKLWTEGLKNVIPDLIKEQKKTNKKPKKRFYKWLKSKVLRTSESNLSEEYFNTAIERIKHHSTSIKVQVDNTLNKLTNENDKSKFLKFSNWLGNIEESLSSLDKEKIQTIYKSIKSRKNKK